MSQADECEFVAAEFIDFHCSKGLQGTMEKGPSALYFRLPLT
jgi:hypothetical protein